MDPGLEFGRVSKSVRHPQFNISGKGKDKMTSLDASHKVWVGGLTDEVTWQVLRELADTVAKSKWVEILGKGQACISYGTAEEAQTAIATLNATQTVIWFDVWTKKEKA